jgi:multisubunit Na+/H+ antiporter MnhC subunit
MIPFTVETVLYAGAIGLIAIGAAGLVMSRHLLRMLLALGIAESGANLLMVVAGFRHGATAPIIGFGPLGAPMVDPVPQVLVLTAIVIGVGVEAMALAVLVRVYRAYRTLDMAELRIRMERDIADAAGIPAPASTHAPAGARPLPPVPELVPVGGRLLRTNQTPEARS